MPVWHVEAVLMRRNDGRIRYARWYCLDLDIAMTFRNIPRTSTIGPHVEDDEATLRKERRDIYPRTYWSHRGDDRRQEDRHSTLKEKEDRPDDPPGPSGALSRTEGKTNPEKYELKSLF
ncbi:hypothetical protein Trydic_g8634 [Trypoxylus dichotomus]